MSLTKHHDLINTDYFSNTLYIKEFEKELKRKLTNNEKEIIEDTLRTFLKFNNEWSNYSNKTEESFIKNKELLKKYINKYERKISKNFVDLFCIDLFNSFEKWLDEMEEIEVRHLDKKCEGIKTQVKIILERLEKTLFDFDFNGKFYYKRNPSNKTKRHYCSLLEYDEDLDNFVNEYNKSNEYSNMFGGIKDDELNYIKEMFLLFEELSRYLKFEEYDEALSEIVDFLVKDKPYLDDIFLNEIKRIQSIANSIIYKRYNNAYNDTIKFIELNKKWFIRAS